MLLTVMCAYILVTVYVYTRVFETGRETRAADDYSSVLDYEEERPETGQAKGDRKLKVHSDHVFIEYNENFQQNSNYERGSNNHTGKWETSEEKTEIKYFEEEEFDKKIRESAKRLGEKLQRNLKKFYSRNETARHLNSQPVRITKSLMKGSMDDATENFEKKGVRAVKRHIEQTEFVRNLKITISSESYNFREIFSGIYLYSSFFDSREEVSFIRFILIGRTRNSVKLWCLLQGNDTEDAFKSEVQFYPTCESHMKDNAVYLASCEVPDEFGRVRYINLTNIENQNPGVSINVISDVLDTGFRFRFATCVPPLFGDINILRLTEFIELSILLGTEQLYFYYNGERDDIYQLLQYYSELGIATHLPWNLSMASHEIWYHGQSAAIWDCMYRNIRVSELVSFNDIDEYIVPKKVRTWNAMLSALQKVARDSISKEQDVAVFSFQSAFFDSNFVDHGPEVNDEYSQLLTSNVTMRTSTISKVRTKMIVYPLKVFELGIHHLSKPVDENLKSVSIPEDIALIHHYRHCEWNYGMNCDMIIKDDSMHGYRKELLSRVRSRLHGFNRVETVSEHIVKQGTQDNVS